MDRFIHGLGSKMGKASKQRFRMQLKKMVDLSYNDPEKFEIEWELRVNSWLKRIRKLKGCWETGKKDSDKLLFDILDKAMAILKKCNPDVKNRFYAKTYGVLCNECCVQVAKVTDGRLYKTSNLHRKLNELRHHNVQ